MDYSKVYLLYLWILVWLYIRKHIVHLTHVWHPNSQCCNWKDHFVFRWQLTNFPILHNLRNSSTSQTMRRLSWHRRKASLRVPRVDQETLGVLGWIDPHGLNPCILIIHSVECWGKCKIKKNTVTSLINKSADHNIYSIYCRLPVL